MEYKITEWDGYNSFSICLTMTILERLDLMGYFEKELELNIKNQLKRK